MAKVAPSPAPFPSSFILHPSSLILHPSSFIPLPLRIFSRRSGRHGTPWPSTGPGNSYTPGSGCSGDRFPAARAGPWYLHRSRQSRSRCSGLGWNRRNAERDVIAQAENRPQRAKERAPRPPHQNRSPQEAHQDGRLGPGQPNDAVAGHRLLHAVGHRRLERSGRAQPANEEPVARRPESTAAPTPAPAGPQSAASPRRRANGTWAAALAPEGLARSRTGRPSRRSGCRNTAPNVSSVPIASSGTTCSAL